MTHLQATHGLQDDLPILTEIVGEVAPDLPVLTEVVAAVKEHRESWDSDVIAADATPATAAPLQPQGNALPVSASVAQPRIDDALLAALQQRLENYLDNVLEERLALMQKQAVAEFKLALPQLLHDTLNADHAHEQEHAKS